MLQAFERPLPCTLVREAISRPYLERRNPHTCFLPFHLGMLLLFSVSVTCKILFVFLDFPLSIRVWKTHFRVCLAPLRFACLYVQHVHHSHLVGDSDSCNMFGSRRFFVRPPHEHLLHLSVIDSCMPCQMKQSECAAIAPLRGVLLQPG